MLRGPSRSLSRLAGVTLVEPGDPTELSAALRAAFADHYGEPPASVGRAPGRVNLIGEHTDYNAGLVLPVALPHATYAAARPRADGLLRITSGQQDEAWEGTLDELGPGSVEGWAGYAAGVAWALREAGHDLPGVDLLVDSRVPVGAGLSSSAALECSVGVALLDLLGADLAEQAQGLIDAAIRAETEVVGAPTGGMDQTVGVRGRAGAALLIDFDSHESTPVPLDLAGHTLLVTDTRVSHALTDGGYGSRRADCERAAAALGVPTLRAATLEAVDALTDDRVRRRARHIVTEIARVTDTVEALDRGAWDEVGRLFDASHRSMRDDFEISCPELDCAVAVAVQAGAVAARMTGGGFGGSSVAVVPDERVDAVMRAVDAAFVLEGFRSPVHLRAVPSAGAAVVRG
jgi:galactokinase